MSDIEFTVYSVLSSSTCVHIELYLPDPGCGIRQEDGRDAILEIYLPNMETPMLRIDSYFQERRKMEEIPGLAHRKYEAARQTLLEMHDSPRRGYCSVTSRIGFDSIQVVLPS